MENLQERLNQCQKDIGVLKEQEAELKRQIEGQEKPKFGDIVELKNGRHKRVWLFDENGGSVAFNRDGDTCGGSNPDIYRKTGRNIFADDLLNLNY